jgi:predicted DNA-binding transcriptional regulator AlpA
MNDTDTSFHNPKLLDPAAAANLLGVTRGTLNIWRCNKRYPLTYIKVGGRLIRYRESDLLDFLKKHTVTQVEP